MHAGDDLAEGRLAGAVLADERVDRAALDLEVDSRQRLDAAEALPDAVERDVDVGHATALSCGCGTTTEPRFQTPVTAPGSSKRERSPGSASSTIASKA